MIEQVFERCKWFSRSRSEVTVALAIQRRRTPAIRACAIPGVSKPRALAGAVEPSASGYRFVLDRVFEGGADRR